MAGKMRLYCEPMTFLAIDVGNTRLKWTLYERPAVGARVLAQGVEFLEQLDRLAEGPWAELPEPTAHAGLHRGGSRPSSAGCRSRWNTGGRGAAQWVVASEAEAGLINGYDFPSRLGADRWVAMIGARHHMLATRAGAPAGGGDGRHGRDGGSA
jgi:type III pantothenate kinase